MKRTTLLFAPLAGIAALILSGCVINTTTTVRDRRPVYGPGPGPVVVEQPAYVVVRRPLPPPPVERIVAPPPGYVWVPGYYEARGDAWVWREGHPERPPRPNAVWVPPRYDNRGTEVHFPVGVWR